MPRSYAKGQPIIHPPGAYDEQPVSHLVRSRRRAQEVQSTAPAQDPRRMPPPSASRRPVAPPTAGSSAPRQRAPEAQSTAPASWAQDPWQMPPPSPSLRLRAVAQPTAVPSPPRQRARPYQLPPPSPSRRPVAVAHPPAASSAPAAVPLPRPPRFVVAISKTAATGYRWPPSSTSSKVRADQVAPPSADATDAWHKTSLVIYSPRPQSFDTEVPILIVFAPTHGPGLEGVALTELARGRGVSEPDTPIGDFIPPGHRWAGAAGRLVIEWPGYDVQPLPLPLKHDKRRYIQRGAFGKLIADGVRSFVENFGDADFVPGGRVLRVGETQCVWYAQLRLLEVVSVDGQDFYLRLAIVPVPPRRTTA